MAAGSPSPERHPRRTRQRRTALVVGWLSCGTSLGVPRHPQPGRNNNVGPLPTPTIASSLNRIECHSWASVEFVMNASDTATGPSSPKRARATSVAATATATTPASSNSITRRRPSLPDVVEARLVMGGSPDGRVVAELWVNDTRRANGVGPTALSTIDVEAAEYRASASPEQTMRIARALGLALPTNVNRALREVVQDAARSGGALTIDVVADAGVAGWPWELVDVRAEKDSPLPVLRHKRALMRRLVQSTLRPWPVDEGYGSAPIRTLMIAGAEWGNTHAPVVTDEEKARWAVGPGQAGDPPERIDGICDLERLAGWLNGNASVRPIDVLVVIAHGRAGKIRLGDDNGATGAELGKIVRGRVRLVMLVACQGSAHQLADDGGANVAAELAGSGVPAIAFHPDVLRETGRAVSRAVTAELHRRGEVSAAFLAAKGRLGDEAATSAHGGLHGLASLWVPTSDGVKADEVRLRPKHRARTGVEPELLGTADPRFDHFVGRAAELTQIRDWVTGDKHQVLGIVGPPGSGKSKLLRHLITEPNALVPDQSSVTKARVVAALLRDHDGRFEQGDEGPMVELSDAAELTTRVGQALAEYLQGEDGLEQWRQEADRTKSDGPIERWRSLVSTYDGFQSCPDDTRLVVVVDALDELEGDQSHLGFRSFLDTALATLPNGVKVIVSGRTPADLPAPGRQELKARLVDLGADDNASATESAIEDYSLRVIAALRHDMKTPLISDNDRAELAKQIAANAEGVFLYARAVLRDSLDYPLTVERQALKTPTFTLPKGLAGFYDQLPERVGANRWPEVRRVLGVLCARRDGRGFTAEELNNLVKDAGEDPVRSHDIVTNTAAAAFLKHDTTTQGDRYREFHFTFKEWVHETVSPDDPPPDLTIAKGLCALFTEQDALDRDNPLASYHRSHTPEHLLNLIPSPGSGKPGFHKNQARSIYRENLCRPDLFELMIWERGPYELATELSTAKRLGVETRDAFLQVCCGLVPDGYAAHATEISHLVQTRYHALANGIDDLVRHCDKRIENIDATALILTAADRSHDPHLRAQRSCANSREVAWHPGGTRLAAATDDGVWLWAVDAGGRIDPDTEPEHIRRPDSARGVAWNQDGTRLAVAGDGGLWVCEADTDGHIDYDHEPEKIPIPHVADCVAWNRDGTRLAAASRRGVWVSTTDDAGRSGPMSQIYDGPHGDGFNDDVYVIEWALDGIHLAVAWADEGLCVLAVDNHACQDHYCEPACPPELHRARDVAWHPNGRRLAVADDDDGVWVWGVDALGRIDPHTEPDHLRRPGHAYGVAWNHDGTRLAAAADGGLWVWEADDDGRVDCNRGPERFFIAGLATCVAWSRAGTRLAAGTFEAGVWVWAVDEHGRIDANSETDDAADSEQVNGVAWNPNGTCIAAASESVHVRAVDDRGRIEPNDGTNRCPVPGSASGVAWNHDGTRLAAAGLKGTRMWAVDDRGHIEPNADPDHLPDHAYGVAWNPNGSRLATAGNGGLWVWWAAIDGSVARGRGPDHFDDPGRALGVAWNRNGSRLAAASNRGVWVWTVDDQNRIDPNGGIDHPPAPGSASGIAWSPDGKQLAAAAGHEGVLVWAIDDHDHIDPGVAPLRPSISGSAKQVTWSPDGTRLAAATTEGVWIYNLDPEPSVSQVISLRASVGDLAWGSTGLAMAAGRHGVAIAMLWCEVSSSVNTGLDSLPKYR